MGRIHRRTSFSTTETTGISRSRRFALHKVLISLGGPSKLVQPCSRSVRNRTARGSPAAVGVSAGCLIAAIAVDHLSYGAYSQAHR